MFLRSTSDSLAASSDATSLSSPSEELPPLTSANAEVIRPLLPAAMLIVRCTGLAGKRMCCPLPFWPQCPQLLNRRSQPNILQRVFNQVRAWLGAFPLHSRPACSPKLRPRQLLLCAFHQCRLLSPERLTKCKVGQTLLYCPLSQLFCCRHLLSLLRL